MYVYLIQAGDKKTDPVKVGFSKNPEKRLKSFQTGNAKELRLIMKIKCNSPSHARRLEKSLHIMLGSQNIHLEWFKLKKTHIMKMLTAFANNKEFDQVEHCANLQHYQTNKEKPSNARKLKNATKTILEMEAHATKRRFAAGIMYGLIYDSTGMTTKEIKILIDDKFKQSQKMG